MRKAFLIAAVMTSLTAAANAQIVTQEHEARARELVGRMTLDEKLEYIGGYNSFYLRAIPRLGIPEIWFADGPQGIRIDSHSTLFPSGMALAATWDRTLAGKTGEGMEEYDRLSGYEAKRRQLQYIGRLMREAQEEGTLQPVLDALAVLE